MDNNMISIIFGFTLCFILLLLIFYSDNFGYNEDDDTTNIQKNKHDQNVGESNHVKITMEHIAMN
jgi:hypothetical protein